jgi:hypothetical protein
MQRFLLSLFVAAAMSLGVAHAQDGEEPTPTDSDTEQTTTPMTPEELDETVRGLGERATLIEGELEKLKAIKISGYVQAEWQHFDQTSSLGGRAFYSDARKNFFTIRRGRIKFHHKLGDVMSYTIQPDISEGGVTLKDAFMSLNFFTNDELRLDAGSFNRPNYEVELSSGARESTERSQVVRAFYPNERDLGVMLSSRLELMENFDPRIQLGVFNGPGPLREVDAIKDIIGRITFPIPIGSDSPVQIDLGASYYYGGIPQTGARIIQFADGVADTIANPESGGMAGFGNNRNVGVESQIYLDLLPFGGTIVRGEFLTGQRATAGNTATSATIGTVKTADGRDSIRVVPGTAATPLTLRNQMGYYVYFIQNIGDDLQLVAKYDAFDRNADLEGTAVKSFAESASSVLGLGVNYFWEHFRFTLYYEMPRFAAEELGAEDAKDNKTTVRMQYRF